MKLGRPHSMTQFKAHFLHGYQRMERYGYLVKRTQNRSRAIRLSYGSQQYQGLETISTSLSEKAELPNKFKYHFIEKVNLIFLNGAKCKGT